MSEIKNEIEVFGLKYPIKETHGQLNLYYIDIEYHHVDEILREIDYYYHGRANITRIMADVKEEHSEVSGMTMTNLSLFPTVTDISILILFITHLKNLLPGKSLTLYNNTSEEKIENNKYESQNKLSVLLQGTSLEVISSKELGYSLRYSDFKNYYTGNTRTLKLDFIDFNLEEIKIPNEFPFCKTEKELYDFLSYLIDIGMLNFKNGLIKKEKRKESLEILSSKDKIITF